jgi:tRNA threonylcarbamoyladenosine biosynthesis protein TsaE
MFHIAKVNPARPGDLCKREYAEGAFLMQYICGMEIVYRLKDIGVTAENLWQIAGEYRVIAFHGSMGAGKTTLIHALCHIKGVKDAVTSPTFSLINEYLFTEGNRPGKIFHIDLYRLNSAEEAMQAGIGDCLASGNTCLVEWPENAPGIFPEETLHVHMDMVNTDTRKLNIFNK